MRIFIIYKYLTVCFTYAHTFYIRISKFDSEEAAIPEIFIFSAFIVRVSRCLFFNYSAATSDKRRANMLAYKKCIFYAIMRIKRASFICFNVSRARALVCVCVCVCNQILLSNFRCFSTNLRSPRGTSVIYQLAVTRYKTSGDYGQARVRVIHART